MNLKETLLDSKLKSHLHIQVNMCEPVHHLGGHNICWIDVFCTLASCKLSAKAKTKSMKRYGQV